MLHLKTAENTAFEHKQNFYQEGAVSQINFQDWNFIVCSVITTESNSKSMIIKDLENFEYLRNRQNNAKLKGVGAVFVMRLNRQGMKEVSGG